MTVKIPKYPFATYITPSPTIPPIKPNSKHPLPSPNKNTSQTNLQKSHTFICHFEKQKMGVNSNRVEDFSSHDQACYETSLNIPDTKTTTTQLDQACCDEAMIQLPNSTTTPTEIHRVCLPPKRSTLLKLKHRLSEIFFPDNPLHMFKNQTWLKKFILGLQYFLPVFQWGPNYSLSLLRSDLISGFTIASLAIPQVL